MASTSGFKNCVDLMFTTVGVTCTLESHQLLLSPPLLKFHLGVFFVTKVIVSPFLL